MQQDMQDVEILDKPKNGYLKPDVWKKKRGAEWLMDLPSGQTVKVWKPHILDLVRIGIMPTQLAESLSHFEHAATEDKNGVKIDGSKIKGDDYKNMISIQEKFFCLAVKEPKIVEKDADESNNEYNISDVPYEDIFHLFVALSSAPSDAPDNFFRGTVETGDTSPDGKRLRKKTK